MFVQNRAKCKLASCQIGSPLDYVSSQIRNSNDLVAVPASLHDMLRLMLEESGQRERTAGAHSPEYIAGTWAACRKLPGFILNELQRQGVNATTLKKVRARRAKIAWCPSHRFEFAASGRSPWMHGGEHAIIFQVRDAFGRPVDIVAWDPKTNRLGSWLGAAVALGQGAILTPRLSDGLLVHRTPLNWLHAGGKGIVIVDAQKARNYLIDAGPLVVEDKKHRRELVTAFTQPLPRILVAPATTAS
jgi:hypothetical protein